MEGQKLFGSGGAGPGRRGQVPEGPFPALCTPRALPAPPSLKPDPRVMDVLAQRQKSSR